MLREDFDATFCRPLAGDRVLIALRRHDPAFFEQWSTIIETCCDRPGLGSDRIAVLLFAVNAVSHPPDSAIDADVHAACDVDVPIVELVEAAVVAGLIEGGVHAFYTGIEAIARVVSSREQSGKSVIDKGEKLPLSDRPAAVNLSLERVETAGPIFPYMVPSPRTYVTAWQRYSPDLCAAYETFRRDALSARQALTRRMEALIFVAINSVVRWHVPLIDHHVHASLNTGATIEDLVETVLASSRRGGAVTMRHGLAAIDRVIHERADAGVPVPRRGELGT